MVWVRICLSLGGRSVSGKNDIVRKKVLAHYLRERNSHDIHAA